MPRLLHELAVGRGDGSFTRLLTRLAKLDLLAIDDWMLAPLRDTERRDLTEVIEDRAERASTLIASQLPVTDWHAVIGDPNQADAICDRLLHRRAPHRAEGTLDATHARCARQPPAGERMTTVPITTAATNNQHGCAWMSLRQEAGDMNTGSRAHGTHSGCPCRCRRRRLLSGGHCGSAGPVDARVTSPLVRRSPAGAHSPLEVSRTIAAACACARCRETPTAPQRIVFMDTSRHQNPRLARARDLPPVTAGSTTTRPSTHGARKLKGLLCHCSQPSCRPSPVRYVTVQNRHVALTNAERQARYRERRKAGEPRIRYRRPSDRRSRPQQWNDAVQTLLELQEQYRQWRDGLPESLAGSATAELLEQVCDLDLSVLETVELPRGFGRDG